MSLESRLKVIIQRATQKYLDEHLERYIDDLNNVAKQWRKWLREQLSTRRPKGAKRNDTEYPYLVTGALRSSIIARRPRALKKTKFNSAGKASVAISIYTYFKKLSGNGVRDYGEVLNSSRRFQNSSFSGWKDRAREELNNRIKERLK